MKLNRNGITRLVIELKRVVIKIPNFTYSWQHFLKGLIANIHENQTWNVVNKYNPEITHLLCPVLWCSWGGWILIMKKVDRCLKDEEYDQWDISEHKKYFEGDDTVSNYGVLDNRLVKIDYGQ